jgi:hypothetical protein
MRTAVCWTFFAHLCRIAHSSSASRSFLLCPGVVAPPYPELGLVGVAESELEALPLHLVAGAYGSRSFG